MFDHIIVPQELAPLRTQAGQLDLQAMYKLACHLIRNKDTIHQYDQMLELTLAMTQHPEFEADRQRECDIYILMTTVMRLGQEEDKLSHEAYLDYSVRWMTRMMRRMVEVPLGEWNFSQMHDTLLALENFSNAYIRDYMQEEESSSGDR